MTHIITIQFEIEGGPELTKRLQDIPPEIWDMAVQEAARKLIPDTKTETTIYYKGRADRVYNSPVLKEFWLKSLVWKLWKKCKGEYKN